VFRDTEKKAMTVFSYVFFVKLPHRLHCDMHARIDDVRIFKKWWHGFRQNYEVL
jgi:hypothetical protein